MIRSCLDRDQVLDLRQAYLSLFPQGFCQGNDMRAGRFSGKKPEDLLPGFPKHGFPGHPAYDFVRTGIFRSFADQPVLKRIASVILGDDVVRMRRTPLRHFIKGNSVASRAHLDGSYIACPWEDVVTFWVPLGDCPLEAGALIYLEDSQMDAEVDRALKAKAPTDRPHDNRPITNDLKWLADTTGKRWLGCDFHAGDIIAHTPGMVHASLDCNSDIMRISADIRFVRRSTKPDPRWTEDWSADDGY